MGDSTTVSGKLDDPVELKAKITVVVVLMLFLVLFFIFLLHVYIKWYWERRREEMSVTSNAAAAARRRSDFAPGYQELSLRRGLEPSMLKTIPILVFTAKNFKDGFECAVCLCQLIEGEKTRFLPKCNHGFHVECIDMWFQSHSSCPICRNLVSSQSNLSPDSTLVESNSNLETANSQNNTNSDNHTSSESPPNFPTNVLFWGNDFEVRTLGNHLEDVQQVVNLTDPSSSFPSSSSRSTVSNNTRLNGGALVIDVSQQVNGDEEPKSPAHTRFRSLKRFLSKDCKRVGPCNARGDIDVELATRS